MLNKVEIGEGLFRRRYIIWPVLGLFALFCGWGKWENGLILWPLGLLLLFGGVGLRVWSIRYIGGAARTRGRKASKLIVSGPYAYHRNPLYVANFLILSGFILLCELPWFLPLAWALLFIQYSFIVSFEEELLKGKFGAPYLDYLQRVPRWIPKLRVQYEPSGLQPRSLRQVLRVERAGILNLVLMIGLAILKEAANLHLF